MKIKSLVRLKDNNKNKNLPDSKTKVKMMEHVREMVAKPRAKRSKTSHSIIHIQRTEMLLGLRWLFVILFPECTYFLMCCVSFQAEDSALSSSKFGFVTFGKEICFHCISSSSSQIPMHACDLFL